MTKAEAGNNATLGLFTADYPGLRIGSTTFQYPGKKVLTNGEKCPTGTPDAGKVGPRRGRLLGQHRPRDQAQRGDADRRRSSSGSNSLVTAGFVPNGTTLPRPAQSIITGRARGEHQRELDHDDDGSAVEHHDDGARLDHHHDRSKSTTTTTAPKSSTTTSTT